MDNALPFLINTGMDGLLLIAVIVVAVTVGKPLSYLNCKDVGKPDSDNSSAYAMAATLGHYLDKEGGKIDYSHWIGVNKSTCLEMKSIWGLSIGLWYVGWGSLLALRLTIVAFSSSYRPSAACACGDKVKLWLPMMERLLLE